MLTWQMLDRSTCELAAILRAIAVFDADVAVATDGVGLTRGSSGEIY